MKKILKLFIVIFISFMPFMVDAKLNYSFDYQIENKVFLYEENGKYYYIDADAYGYNTYPDKYIVYIYDKNGSLLSSDKFFDESKIGYEDFLKTKIAKKFYELLYNPNDVIYDEDTNKYYGVNYINSIFLCRDFRDSNTDFISIPFNHDINFTKKLLGKKYDLFEKLLNKSREINYIRESNGYYIAGYASYVALFDENLKELFRLRDDEAYAFSYAEVYDGLFYIFRDDLTLEVYNLDGIKKDTLNVVNDLIIPEEILHCDNYNRKKFYIFDNEILLYYTYEYYCPQRVEMNDASDALNTVTYERPTIHDFVLKYSYSIDYNVIKKDTKNGDFTYTSKNDGDGKEYIELNIKPNEGYSIKEIIVTDVNGNKIEVKDNKFYMPLSDVYVEVKFIKGEYIPIPNTALGQNISFILIGLSLIGLGIYVSKFVKREE